jgi:hypothetical protein
VRDNPNATKNAVDTALAALVTAIAGFDPKPGTSEANKSNLTALIEQVRGKLKDLATSEKDGTDIPTEVKWVTAQAKKEMEDALKAAVLIETNAKSRQDEVDRETEKLTEVFNRFNPQSGKQLGGIFSCTFTSPQDETVTLTGAQILSWEKNDELHVTADGFDSYQWIVDGTIRDGKTATETTLCALFFLVIPRPPRSTLGFTLFPYTKTLIFTVN